MRRIASWGALAPLVLALACGSRYSAEDPPLDREAGAGDGGDASIPDGTATDGGDAGLPECTAQRVVDIVAGSGGLAWFTLAWPVPDVIAAYAPNYAYDDPAKAVVVGGTEADHPLYARKVGTHGIWQSPAAQPSPSVLVVGQNQTHTASPQNIRMPGGVDVIAAGALAQVSLGAPLPVLAFSPASIGAAPGAPAVQTVALVEDAVSAITARKTLSAAETNELRPAPATVTAWVGAAPTTARNVFAQKLLLAANALRMGLVSTVLVPAFNDDPHGVFSSGDAALGADTLATILDGFYAELAKSYEKSCGHNGKPLSIADNTVLVVNGDTFKNPYDKSTWPDGTPGGANLFFVRSNGFLKPGWIGRITATSARTNFNPVTGVADTDATVAESTTAAVLGILYAITRGNKATVDAIAAGAPYSGVLAPKP